MYHMIMEFFAPDFRKEVLIEYAKNTIWSLIRNPLVFVLLLCWIVKQFVIKYYDSDKGIKETKAIEITSTKHYNEVIHQTRENTTLTVFYFYAPWVPNISISSRLFASLSLHYCNDDKKCLFYKLNIDKYDKLSKSFKLVSVPSFVFYRQNIEIDRVTGIQPDELMEKLSRYYLNEDHSSASASASGGSSTDEAELKEE